MCGKGSYWKLLLCATPEEMSQNLKRRPPVVTLVFFALCFAFYYGGGGEGSEWIAGYAYVPLERGAERVWYTPVTSIFMHLNLAHLLSNALVLVWAGVLLEVTEGSLHMWNVCIGAGTLGCGYHGVYADSRVRGASGAIYGVLWSQIGLLALNWSDMPGRWVRLLIALGLFAAELTLYIAWHDERIAYQAHLFGSLAGIFISLVSGKNVVLYRWELLLNVGGIIGYVGLVAGVCAGAQWAAAGWAALIVPLLLFDTWRNARRLKRERKQPASRVSAMVTAEEPAPGAAILRPAITKGASPARRAETSGRVAFTLETLGSSSSMAQGGPVTIDL